MLSRFSLEARTSKVQHIITVTIRSRTSRAAQTQDADWVRHLYFLLECRKHNPTNTQMHTQDANNAAQHAEEIQACVSLDV